MHVQGSCFGNRNYFFLTFSLPSASLDLKVPIVIIIIIIIIIITTIILIFYIFALLALA